MAKLKSFLALFIIVFIPFGLMIWFSIILQNKEFMLVEELQNQTWKAWQTQEALRQLRNGD